MEQFFVQAVDQYNHNITTSENQFQVTINDNNHFNLTNLGDGLFVFQNNFTVASNYLVSVNFSGKSLLGSPFSFSVFPAAVFPGGCQANGEKKKIHILFYFFYFYFFIFIFIFFFFSFLFLFYFYFYFFLI